MHAFPMPKFCFFPLLILLSAALTAQQPVKRIPNDPIRFSRGTEARKEGGVLFEFWDLGSNNLIYTHLYPGLIGPLDATPVGENMFFILDQYFDIESQQYYLGYEVFDVSSGYIYKESYPLSSDVVKKVDVKGLHIKDSNGNVRLYEYTDFPKRKME